MFDHLTMIQSAHLVQIRLQNFKPDAGNAHELDHLSDNLVTIEAGWGNVSRIASCIATITDHVMTLQRPDALVPGSGYRGVELAHIEAKNAAAKLMSLVTEQEMARRLRVQNRER